MFYISYNFGCIIIGNNCISIFFIHQNLREKCIHVVNAFLFIFVYRFFLSLFVYFFASVFLSCILFFIIYFIIFFGRKKSSYKAYMFEVCAHCVSKVQRPICNTRTVHARSFFSWLYCTQASFWDTLIKGDIGYLEGISIDFDGIKM